jgi:hypothetical protein
MILASPRRRIMEKPPPLDPDVAGHRPASIGISILRRDSLSGSSDKTESTGHGVSGKAGRRREM